MKRVISYLRGKEKHELTITIPNYLRIISFGDASFGDCRETRRSSTGDINTLGGSIISWRSQKTKTVCLSSTEAEYIALMEMSKEQKFLVMSMEEVFDVELPCYLYEDNKAAVYLTKNMHISSRTKHIDIKYHYIQEHIKNKMGEVLPIDSEDNYVDILTKNVNVKVFEKLSNGILNGFRDDFGKAIFSNNQRENV